MRISAAFCSILFFLVTPSAFAQGTAFTYQGSLRENGSPASGIHDLRFTIYDALTGGSAVSSAVTNAATGVSNGLFAVTLDMGPGVFTGAERWLEIGVRTNGSPDDFAALVPRQPITATPYAIFSTASGSVSNGLIQDPLFLGTTGNRPLELFAGSQRALRLEPNTNGAPNLIGGSVVNQVDPGVIGATISGGGAANYFGGSFSNRIAADFSTIGGGSGNFIDTNASSSFIGGGGGNLIEPSSFGATIAGGFGNIVRANAGISAIGGGYWNVIGSNVSASVIGGGGANTNASGLAGIASGYLNTIEPNAGLSFLGGGQENAIEANAGMSVIGGGWQNRIYQGAGQSVIAGGNNGGIESGAANSFIGGGWNNRIQGGSQMSAISGGSHNRVGSNSWAGMVGGGEGNTISNNNTAGIIGGGWYNHIQSDSAFSVIGGGQENAIEANAGRSVIGGGWLNRIHQFADESVIAGGNAGKIFNGARESFIGGGFANTIGTNSRFSVIGGGTGNDVGSSAIYSTIGGGQENSIGVGARQSFIGGGIANRILDGTFQSGIMGGSGNSMSNSGAFSVIAGGVLNHIGNNVQYGVVGGGNYNTVRPFAHLSTIGGGQGNRVFFNSQAATISGGRSNVVAGFGVVGGGDFNTNRGFISAIGGGRNNLIGDFADHSVIAGGGDNEIVGAGILPLYGVIGGGQSNSMKTNAIYSAIGGGLNNTILANAQYATIPGGASNAAAGRFSLAAGNRAQALHDGAFVWGDSQDTNLTSSAPNQFLIRASGGVGIGTNNPSAPLEVVGTIKAGSFATTGTISGNGSGVTNVNAASLSGQAAGNFWQLSGNNVAAGQFLGSTNNQPLEFKANGMRALRIEFGGDSWDSGSQPDGAPNIIGGAPNNVVPPGVVGATIAGGGATNHWGVPHPQILAADFGVIGGGYGNTIGSNATYAVISGGRDNRIGTNSYDATIVGGGQNTIEGSAFSATIAGGGNNRIAQSAIGGAIGGGGVNLVGAQNSTIAGGNSNTNLASGSTIGGGGLNQILGGVSATIGGGWQNIIESFGWYSTVGGGSDNRVRSQYAGIFNGANNLVEEFADYSVIGGGRLNRIDQAGYAAVLGGSNNIASGVFSAIGGGVRNEAIGRGAVVPGGENNQANGQHSFAAGYRAKAIHRSTFVWADSTDADFSSTWHDQFLIRASGGVGIGTGNPSARLHVYTDTANAGDNTAMFQAPNLGPNLSHIHHGTLGDWYIRSASSSGKVVLQDAGGRVGIGTSNPQQPLHLNVTSGEGMRIDSAIAGHNPAIYLNHTGFAGRNYRIASFGDNSTDGSFRIRDETGGADRFIIDANGQITSPGNLAFGSQTRQMLNLWSTGYGIGVQSGTFYSRSDANFAWYRGGTHNNGELNAGGGTEAMRLTSTELRVNGAFVSSSDRNVKAGFEPVDSKAILEKVAALPITRWYYTNDHTATPHLGPVAQDFHTAFGVGSDEKYIATVDADGVALAAIQGLNQKLDEELKRSREKDAKISALEERLAKLEEILTANQR